MEDPIRIFIGYDATQPVAWHVAAHSAIVRSSMPVMVSPIILSHVRKIHGRAREPKASTEFSITRFLVPWLCGYAGWAIFVDCDVLFRADPAELWALRDEKYAVQVVKHRHKPRESVKFLKHEQTTYPRKNWSSVMLFNCGRCKKLSTGYVNSAGGLDLHGFSWLDDSEIGELNSEWNHLVGYDRPSETAKIIHYTLGGPWLAGFENVEHSRVWSKELRAAMHSDSAGFHVII